MYGMIHTAARELVMRSFSEENWESLNIKHGFSEEDFISGKTYDDERTFDLIGAIAEETQVELPKLLEEFGEYWIEYSAKSSFGSVYKLYGQDIFQFFENLNRMHDTIEATLPTTKTPIFECIDHTKNSIEILYSSHRIGLDAFVIGLFRGLLHYFELNGKVEQINSTRNGSIFQISIL